MTGAKKNNASNIRNRGKPTALEYHLPCSNPKRIKTIVERIKQLTLSLKVDLQSIFSHNVAGYDGLKTIIVICIKPALPAFTFSFPTSALAIDGYKPLRLGENARRLLQLDTEKNPSFYKWHHRNIPSSSSSALATKSSSLSSSTLATRSSSSSSPSSSTLSATESSSSSATSPSVLTTRSSSVATTVQTFSQSDRPTPIFTPSNLVNSNCLLFSQCITENRLTPLHNNPWPDFSYPTIFDGRECWLGTRDEKAILGEALLAIGSGTAYQVGFASTPLLEKAAAIGHVVKQLHDPDPNQTFFMINVKIPDWMTIPSQIASSQDIHEKGSTSCSANLTPQFTLVDLHVDLGMHGLSTSIGQCEKTWALYPPTTRNLDLLYSQSGQDMKFLKVAKHLEHGRYVVTKDWESLYIPAGCLHVVYTMTGGILAGINWSTAGDMEVLEAIFDREILHGNFDMNAAIPVIRTCSEAYTTGDDKTKLKAEQLWCRCVSRVKKCLKLSSLYSKGRDAEFEFVQKLMGKNKCRCCGKKH